MSSELPLSRRRLLGLGTTLPLLAACSPSGPTVQPTPTSSGRGSSAAPSPSPSTGPTGPPVAAGVRTAAGTELALAVLGRGILTGPRRRQPTTDQRRLLSFVVAAHRSHATALDPSVAPSRVPDLAALTPHQALARLARNQATAAASHRAAALTLSGDDTLRLGSVAAATGLYARVLAAGRPATISPGPRTPPLLARTTDVAAVQSLVAQLHALVYGYQLAIGRMSVAGRRDDQAVAELLQHRIRRDRLIGWLRRRRAEVPEPEPAYRPSVEVHDQATAARLVRTMLVALQPYAGIWLAAAAEAEREWALTFFRTTVDLARAWDAPLPVWPGGAG